MHELDVGGKSDGGNDEGLPGGLRAREGQKDGMGRGWDGGDKCKSLFCQNGNRAS